METYKVTDIFTNDKVCIELQKYARFNNIELHLLKNKGIKIDSTNMLRIQNPGEDWQYWNSKDDPHNLLVLLKDRKMMLVTLTDDPTVHPKQREIDIAEAILKELTDNFGDFAQDRIIHWGFKLKELKK